jgi:hypothetical protein
MICERSYGRVVHIASAAGIRIAKIAKPTIEISDKVRLNLEKFVRGVEKNSERKKRK